ncbi:MULTISPECIES: MipA/OmpV family protein [Cysteiniphilum]|uniref:MipA/OmpV family protein n=1 Tax=Cysteiniphilum TaxID=2056696 RepID=UPI00177BC130|nr:MULTISPECIES: MipA/OmpV family protein [Cysteiniphilum]
MACKYNFLMMPLSIMLLPMFAFTQEQQAAKDTLLTNSPNNSANSNYGETQKDLLSKDTSKIQKEQKEQKQKQKQKQKHFNIQHPWSIGVASIFTPNPYKATDDNILAFPMIAYKGEDLTILGPYIAYRLIGNRMFSFSVDGFLYPQKFDASKSTDPQLQKLNDRNYMFMGGFSSRFNSAYGSLQLGLNLDLTAGTHGLMANMQYTKPFILQSDKHQLIISPGGGVQWTQNKILDYFYGISASESALSGLQEYSPGSAFSPYLSLSLMYRYNKRWGITSVFRLNQLASTVQDSPMVGQSYVLTSAISFTYSF